MYIVVGGEDNRLEDGCLMRTALEIDLTTKGYVVATPLEYRHVSVTVLG